MLHGSRQRSVSLVIVKWLMFLMPGLILAQAPEREALTQPVLRVQNSGEATEPAAASPAAPAAPTPAVKDEAKVASLSPDLAAPKIDTKDLPEPQRLLNEAIVDAHKCVQHIQSNIKDYTCLLVKRERVNGSVLPTEYMEAKIRNRKVVDGKVVVPFSIYMKFLKPSDCRGREVVFVEGKNNGKLLAKEGGFRGRLLPSVWLLPTGRIAMETNRYPIWEAGVENLAARLIERAKADSEIDKCIVTYRSGAKIDNRKCKFLEVRRPVPKAKENCKSGMNVFLAQVFIDEEWNIPIRYGAYDWPETPGERPEVVEEYTYQRIKLNVGLTDADFDSKNPAYSF